jgi:hypothetical protein
MLCTPFSHMRRLLPAIAALALAAADLSCGTRQPAEWNVVVEPVDSPAAANSSEPFLSVSDRGVLLSWIEREGTMTRLKFVERVSSGWTAPITAASGPDWFLSYADVPSVLRLSNGALVAQWLKTTEERIEAYDLRMSYSTDNGKTWASPFTPHHDRTTTQHGFATLLEMPGNGVGVVWLDGRNSAYEDDRPESGTMFLRFAAFDANWKQIADTDVDRRVCECCPTAAVMTSAGVLTAFRDRSETEVRDISVSRLENGAWTAATTISNDNWQLDVCPVNGPALSARGSDVAAAWFTVKNDQGQAYAAFSSDSGRSWTAPIRLDEAGSLGRVDVELLDDGSAVATWIEYADGRSDFRLRRVERTGGRSAPVTVSAVSGGRASGYPRLARSGGELVFAWTASAEGSEQGGLEVQTAVAPLP